jgi:UDP-N-acetylmuramate--alanine ligase
MQHHGGYVFDVVAKGWKAEGMRLHIGGMHNVENSIAAIAVTQMLGISIDAVRDALEGFKGIKRRFEYLVHTDEHVYIDDYAHHPEELASLIKSAKRLFPGHKCVIAFQPHLFSRTRDLADGFAQSLDMADEVILLDVYPARELPMEGITAETITSRMANPAHTILTKEGLVEYVRNARPALFITAGAGDIDKLTEPIKELLQNN